MMVDQLEVPLSVKVAEWKAKALAGLLTEEDSREWIRMVRAGRVSAQKASTTSRAAKAPIDVDALMDQLDKL